MIRDLRFPVRRLFRSPGFTTTVILLLGLTLGANASMFSVLYGLLYKPLPFAAAERIVALDVRIAYMNYNVGLSVPYFEEMAATSKTLETIAAFRERQLNSGDDDAAASTYNSALVQPAILSMLGAQPVLGRLFVDEDTQDGAARSVVIASDLWQARYDGAADVIGKNLKLADGDYRIVGVLPGGFGFPRSTTQLWLPLHFSAAERAPDQGGWFGKLYAIARLKPPATPADVAGEMASVARNVAGLKEIVDQIGFQASAEPLRSLWLGNRASALELMLLAVALVLLVAVANICNLYIARLLARRQELALLDALGASPWRRLRQTIAETLTLCLTGALLGILVIAPSLELLRRFDLIPADAPQAIGIEPVTLVFIVALALVLALVMAGSATWLQRRNLALAIRAGGTRQTAGLGAQRARQALIVAQIALTAALLVGIGLLLRSSQRLLAEDVGFDADRLAITGIADLPHVEPGVSPDVSAADAARATMREAVERTRALPGVTAVGLGTIAPFGWSMGVTIFALPGEEDRVAAQSVANRAYVNADYFTALGTPLLRGRAFTPEEARTHADVTIIDRQFAQQVFGDRDALGQKIMMDTGDQTPLRARTIVGVVPTLKLQSLKEKAERPTAYQPEELPLNGMLLVRTQSDPALLAAPIKELFRTIAPRARLREVVPMRERIADTLRDAMRLNALLELLGAMALTLAAVGLYAVLAYSVRMRTNEFGIRMALGASGSGVLQNVLWQGVRLIVAGLLLALPLAYLLTTLLATRLYRIGAFDPVTLIGVATLLGVVALLACWLPALRAARVSPIEALRYE